MSDHVTNYVNAEAKLTEAFKCTGEYLLRPCLETEWDVSGGADGSYLLNIYGESGDKQSFMLAKKNKKPMTYHYGMYTMIVAIDCVKVAFILKNKGNREVRN